MGGNSIALKSYANGQYVCADLNLANPPRLIANRTTPGSWETFTECDAGNGNIALRSTANGRYVSADLSLALPRLVGAWARKPA